MKQSELRIRKQDLEINPAPRVPICLCVDTSASMLGEKIKQLNAGIRLFFDTLRKNDITLYSVELCIVTFGGFVECKQDFMSLERYNGMSPLLANGDTPMCEAVKLALEKLNMRKDEYKQHGVDYYQPWLVLMSDGKPTDPPETLLQVQGEVIKLAANKKLLVLPIAIRADESVETRAETLRALQGFSPEGKSYAVDALESAELFTYLSKSAEQVSQSTPGTAFKFPTYNWDTLS